MYKLLKWMTAAAAAFGLAFAGTALAQKAEPPKADAPKKMDEKKADAGKKMDEKKADAGKKMDDKKADAKPAGQIDINSATEAELATLKGIGEARAKAIVKGRPYKGKDDLVKKKIIPESVYNDIKDQIIAKQDMAKAEPKKEEKKAEMPKKDEAKKDEKKK